MKARIMRLLMSLLLALPLSSCTADSDLGTETSAPADETDSTATETNPLDKFTDYNFDGETFTILDVNNLPTIHINLPTEESTGDIINDGLLERNRAISELLGVTFEYEQITDFSVGSQTLRNSVMAGEEMYDLVFSTISGGMLGTLALEGILANLCDIDALTLDADWWSRLIYDNCRINDVMYYTAGDISPAVYYAPACYFANKRLLLEYSISPESIYEAVENGSWTLDYLYALTADMSTDLNNDGILKIDDDFFGVMNETNALTAAVFATGAGIQLSSSDKDGNINCNFANDRTLETIDKLKLLLSNASASNNTAFQTAFMDGRAVFFMHYVSSAYTRYREMTDDFMILPIPKFDETQDSYYSLYSSWGNSSCAIPADANTELSGVVSEALAIWSHYNLRPQVYDLAFKNKGARSEKDAEMLDIIFDTLYLDFNSFEDFGGSLTALSNAVFKSGSFMSDFASIAEAANAEAANFRDSWLN